MSIRDNLLTELSTRVAGTNFRVSTELPWQSGDVDLYVKNKKNIYVDKPQSDITEMYLTLRHDCDVYQNDTIVEAYVAVDAKNEPTDTDAMVASLIAAKDSITDQIKNLCEVQTEITGDVNVYTFTYTFTQIYAV
jgi:hypothetical protein